MNKFLPKSLMLAAVLGATWPVQAQSLFPDLGSQRTGISGFQFLKIPVSARAAALGQTGITLVSDASSIYSNPALAVDVSRNDASFTYASWLSELTHSSASLTYKLTDRDAVSFGVMALQSPLIEVTTTANPTGTGETFSYGDYVGMLSYSRRMTEQFSFGVTAKFIRESIAAITIDAFAVDLGLCYKVPLLGIRFAAVVENFGTDATPRGTAEVFGVGTLTDFQSLSLPTLFRLGFSLDPVSDGQNRLTTLAQLNHPNDNSETIAFGLEYSWREIVYLRAGYNLGRDEQGAPDLGLGLNTNLGFARVKFDYAFVGYTNIGSTHRITVGLGNFKF